MNQDFSSKKDNSEGFQISYGSDEPIHPIQLISFTESKDIYIHEDALNFFLNLKDINFATISVVGKYRTGKSYLLNRVLLDKSDAFSVGPTINPCTKGLWIWPSLIEVTNNQIKTKILVIDTEGIGAYNEEENHDMKIFLLAMLLSSFFIYNSVGNIDEMAIQNLSLIINLGKHLQKSNDKEFDDLISVFPNFLWVVRDFALKLLDPFGNPITSKEYLESALKSQKGMSEAMENKNRIRRLITSFFKERDCAMLVRPLQNESEIQNLSKIPLNNLRPEFVNQVLNLRRKIFSKIKPKSFKGKLVNGNTFIQMCRIFCDSINKGEIPSIQNSWNSVCKLECQRLVYHTIESYTTQMDIITAKKPVEFNILHEKQKEIKKNCLINFSKNSYGDDKQFFLDELIKGIKTKYQHYIQENIESFKVVLKEYVENRYNLILENLESHKISSLSEIEVQIKELTRDLETQFINSPQILNSLNSLICEALLSLTQKFIEIDHSNFKRNDMLTEGKVKLLEERIASLMKENETNSQLFNDKIMELESQKSNDLFHQKRQLEKKEKDLEEKLTKIEDLKKKLQDLEKELKDSMDERDKLKKSKEVKENSINLLNIEYNKIMALIQQKNDFLQKETEDYKEKISDLEEIIKILKENLENISNEKLLLEDKILENSKEKYNNLEIKHKELLKEKERLLNNFKIEKEYLGKELIIAKSQLEDNKKNNDLLLKTLTTSRKMNTEHSCDHNSGNMLKANKNLSVALEKSEGRCTDLEKRIEKLNIYQKVIKNSVTIECKVCLKCFPFEIFVNHMNNCKRMKNSEFQFISFEVKYESNEENKFKKEFDIDVFYKEKSWTLKKTFKTFRYFSKQLGDEFPDIKSKPFYLSFATKLKKNSNFIKLHKQSYFESKKIQITKFLNEIIKINEIRNLKLFETFFAIDIHEKTTFKHEKHDTSSISDQNSILENDNYLETFNTYTKNTNNFLDNSHIYYKNDKSLLSNKENVDLKDFSDKKALKKTLNESRTSLKNISFKELFNDVSNKLSASNKNHNLGPSLYNKMNITSNKHLNLLALKTPRSTAFYAKDSNEDTHIIKSPLNLKEDHL